MPLQNYQYDTIMREYNRRQARNRRIQEEHLAEAYEKIPRLREIDEEVATLSARKARALISRQEVGIEDLRNDIALLSQERTALLLSSGYPADYLEMSYTCPLCQDTGYIGSQKCSCFKKAEIELLYTQSNLKEILEKEPLPSFRSACAPARRRPGHGGIATVPAESRKPPLRAEEPGGAGKAEWTCQSQKTYRRSDAAGAATFS